MPLQVKRLQSEEGLKLYPRHVIASESVADEVVATVQLCNFMTAIHILSSVCADLMTRID